MSSWDAYIDSLIELCRDSSGNSHCDQACIIGLDGGTSWTSPAHVHALRLSGHEACHIAGCMRSRDVTSLQNNGVNVGGERFLFLRQEDNGKILYAKKKGCGALTLQATKTAIIIAHCAEGKQQGNVNKGTARIADYLESVNM